VRAYKNAFAQEWQGRENELRDRLSEILPRYAAARQRGDWNTSSVLLGESASFIHAIRSAEDVLRSICEGAERLLRERSEELLA
jgi:nitronate monooxygenase